MRELDGEWNELYVRKPDGEWNEPDEYKSLLSANSESSCGEKVEQHSERTENAAEKKTQEDSKLTLR